MAHSATSNKKSKNKNYTKNSDKGFAPAVAIVPADPNDPPSYEIIAESIALIALQMRALSSSRLSREAIVVLIKDRSGIPKKTIEIVFNNLETLDRVWLKRQN